MDEPLWLERLRVALARRRLPSAYAERLAQELADHFHDLTEEKMSTEALEERLGQPEQLADVAEAAYRRHGLFQRHRWLRVTTFVLLPLPVLVIGWALTFAALCLVAWGVGSALGEARIQEQERSLARGLTPLQDFTIHGVLSAVIIVPAIALVGLYFALASKTYTRKRWAVAAGLLLACCAGSATSQMTFSDEPGKNTLMVGLGVGNHYTHWQLAQFALPLAAAFLFSRGRVSELFA